MRGLGLVVDAPQWRMASHEDTHWDFGAEGTRPRTAKLLVVCVG